MQGSTITKLPCQSTISYFLSLLSLNHRPCSGEASYSSKWVKIVNVVTFMQTQKWCREPITRSHFGWLPIRYSFLFSEIFRVWPWQVIQIVGLGRWTTRVIVRGYLAMRNVSQGDIFLGWARSTQKQVPCLLPKSLKTQCQSMLKCFSLTISALRQTGLDSGSFHSLLTFFFLQKTVVVSLDNRYSVLMSSQLGLLLQMINLRSNLKG